MVIFFALNAQQSVIVRTMLNWLEQNKSWQVSIPYAVCDIKIYRSKFNQWQIGQLRANRAKIIKPMAKERFAEIWELSASDALAFLFPTTYTEELCCSFLRGKMGKLKWANMYCMHSLPGFRAKIAIIIFNKLEI